MTLELFGVSSASQYSPGPGSYNVDTYNSIGGPLSRKSRFNTMDRPMNQGSKTVTSDVEYMPAGSTLSSNGKTIGKRLPEAARQSYSLGPSYLPNPADGFRKSVKIKGRYPEKDNSMYPGPGHYSPKEWSKSQGPPMGPRPPIILDSTPASPGPAAYTVSRELSDNSLKFSIRPLTSVNKAEEEDPGFKYNKQRTIGEDAPSFTISRSVQKRDYSTDVPGPGTYDPTNKSHSRKLAPSIHPVIPRKVNEREDVPYENTRRFPDTSKAKTIATRCGKRESILWGLTSDTPGPSWLPNSSLEMRNITIRSRIPEKNTSADTPGPCSYNIQTYANALRKTEPSFSIKGPSERSDWVPRDAKVPGPGEYKVETKNELPKWTIGERSISRARASRATTSMTHSRQRETTSSALAATF